MKHWIIVVCMALLGLQSEAQTIRYTKITNPGKIISTPKLCTTTEWMKALQKEIGKDFADELCEFAEESTWPSGINTFDERHAGGSKKMMDYNCYYLADLAADRVLLWVAMSENAHMPENMRDGTDFLICIYGSACALGDKVKLENINGDDQTKTQEVSAFAEQLGKVLKDFEYDFANIKGDKKPADDGFSSNEYISKVQLEGTAEPCYLTMTMSGKLRFIAPFGNYTDKAEARKQFDAIVHQIDYAPFPCCTFAKNDLFEKESMVSQTYLPFDTQNKMSDKLEKVLLEVELIKGMDLKDNKFVDSYTVVLRVVAQ